MSEQIDSLRDIYMDVAGEETLVDRQRSDISRDPVEEGDIEEAVSDLARHEALDDAIAGAEGGDAADPAAG